MFKELHAVARHTPLHLAITPQDGGRLKVIVTPLPTGKAKDYEGLSKQFSAVGTPEELDAEFIDALNQYAGKVTEVRAKIGLPLDELDKVKESAAKRDAKAQKKADEKAADEARLAEAKKKREDAKVARKAEAERKTAERAEKRAAKKAAKSGGIKLPGTSQTPAAAPTDAKESGARSESVRADLPGKEECIRDYRQLKLKHGDKLTRRMFIKKADTGRRYERLWSNWEQFLKEANAQAELPLEPGDDETKRILAGKDPKKQGKEIEEVLEQTAEGERRAKESGIQTRLPEPAEAADDQPPRWGEATDMFSHVFDTQHNYLSSITTNPVLGEHIGLVSQEKLLRIVSIDTRPSGGLDITVVPDPEETARRAEAVAERVRAQAAERIAPLVASAPSLAAARAEPTPGPARNIAVLEHGTRKLLGIHMGDPDAGEIISLTDRPGDFLVDSVVPNVEVIAHEVLPEPYLVIDEEGTRLGESGEVYQADDKVMDLGMQFAEDDWRVYSVDKIAHVYCVKNAKAKYRVFTEEEELIIEYRHPPQVGEKLTVPDRAHPFRVLAIDDHRVTARMILPTKNRIVDHVSGEALGHTEEVYDVADQVAELAPKDYRVVKVELDAYVVKLTKPRVNGPAAVAAASLPE